MYCISFSVGILQSIESNKIVTYHNNNIDTEVSIRKFMKYECEHI